MKRASVPRASYRGVQLQQHPDALPAIEGLLRDERFDLIVELGTGNGGLTAFLADHARPDCRLLTYDNKDLRESATVRSTVTFRVADVFSAATISEITSAWQASHRALIVCDDGNKPDEVWTYSEILRVGDILMVHDFSWGRRYFRAVLRHRWPWCEVLARDIAVDREKYTLRPYRRDVFEPVAWGVFIKELP